MRAEPDATALELPRLSLRGVSKRFGSLAAVEGITLDVRRGEFLSLLGPSGCGKSTVLHMIAGFERPDAGTIEIDGRPVTGPGKDRLVIFQEPGLMPWLTVAENAGFGLPRKPRELYEETVRNLLRLVHLERFGEMLPHQLSGGMKQRAALARAIAVDPDVLLMDEPFAALDPQTREMLHGDLQEIWMGTRKTVVFVTHSVEEAVRLSDRVAILATHPGRVRRVIPIDLPHPRDFNSAEIAGIRREIREEMREEMAAIARGRDGAPGAERR